MTPPSSSTAKTAIITGAAMGLGHQIAVQLAKDGFNVVVNDLPKNQSLLDQLVKDVEKSGGAATAHAADASDQAGVQGIIDTAVSKYGKLDVMVCNAGIAMVKPMLECTYDDVQKIFDVNYRATWHGYHLAAAQMIKQGHGGRIIGATSIVAKKGYPFMSIYSSVKFAIRGLTQAAAQEFGSFGITVNTYAPGCVWTPLIEGLGAEVTKYLGQPGLDPKAMWAQTAALKRVGETEDVANLVSFLASDKSAFITGQSITIDGGSVYD